MAPALRQRLLDAYREDTLALADFLGRDLSAWRALETAGERQISSEASSAPREAMK